MPQQRPRQSSGGRLDFPGALTAAVLGALLGVIWPWVLLHGIARVVVGVVWTLIILTIAAVWAADKWDNRKAAAKKDVVSQPQKNVVTSVRHYTTVTARGTTISFRGRAA